MTTGGFFGIGGTTYKVYEGTNVESDDLGKVIDDGDMALLGRRIPVFGNTGRRALGKVGPEFQYKELEVVDGYLKDESSLHESAKGKLVWKDGGYFHDEFGRTGLFSSGVGSAGDPLGYSYQYGERICDYYLGALELPKPSDPK